MFTKEASAKTAVYSMQSTRQIFRRGWRRRDHAHGGAMDKAQRLDSPPPNAPSSPATRMHARTSTSSPTCYVPMGGERLWSVEPFDLNLGFKDTSMPGSVPGKGRGVAPTTDMVVIEDAGVVRGGR